jgi:hypothetical protein
VDAWVQTSLDQGVTWIDIAQFHFGIANKIAVFNLSKETSRTTELTPTYGALAADTAVDGVIGSMLRVKYTVVGTYAGTALQIDAIAA